VECNCGTTTNLLMAADFADPVWCAVCKVNLDLDEMPVSDALKRELEDWTKEFGKWIDWDSDLLKSEADKAERAFNQKGEVLFSRLQEALPSLTITYQPSFLCLLYRTACY
jgi:hypothetical protein